VALALVFSPPLLPLLRTPPEPEPEPAAEPADCFLACPSSVLRHRVAKFSEQTVSPKLYTAGLMFTNVSTLEFPPSESWEKNTNSNKLMEMHKQVRKKGLLKKRNK
jgi:hypothetical protein